jgi:DNA-binding NtrC family response regulator
MNRVLLVDDESMVVRMLGQSLAQAGFMPMAAVTGEQALGLLDRATFDAALVDKNLGRGIDGVEVLRHVRKRQPRCACLLMTAYPSMGSAVEALRLGVQDYLEKPSPELDAVADRILGAIRHVRLEDEREGLTRKLNTLQNELRRKDAELGQLRVEVAMASELADVRANEAAQALRRAAHERDARLIASAEALLPKARALRGTGELVAGIEAHVAALRRG